MRVSFLLCALAFAAGAARAQEGLPGLLAPGDQAEACFERVYPADHLAANPRQRTVSMRLGLKVEAPQANRPDQRQTTLRLELRLRGDDRPWYAIGDCVQRADANVSGEGDRVIPSYPRRGGVGCMLRGEGLDAEGGYLILEPVSREAIRLHVTGETTLRRGGRVSDGPGRSVALGGADGVFRLGPAPAGACAGLTRAISDQ